jgi:integrase
MRRKVLASLKTLIAYAQAKGLVAQNVAREVRMKAAERHKGKLEIPTKAELRVLMDRAPVRFRPFLVTAIFTGMRASELRGLRWEDVDLEAGIIHVRQRADAWGSMGPPKSEAGDREIPLAPIVLNTLKALRKVSQDGLVFPNGAGKVESHTNIVHRAWGPLQMAAGVTREAKGKGKGAKPVLRPKYGLHALRHAAASLFIEQGWTPKRIQAVMGHSSITMTFDTYGHLFRDLEADRDAMAKVEAAVLAS